VRKITKTILYLKGVFEVILVFEKMKRKDGRWKMEDGRPKMED